MNHKKNFFLKIVFLIPFITTFLLNKKKNNHLAKLDNQNKILWYLKEED